ncbi:MAG: archaeal proteasome endopeptidase complex subunit beta [Candidatus Odinarchaeia archaeon]
MHNYPKDVLNRLKTGTTTVGITCDKGIVLGADKRATSGYLVANKTAKKIFKLDDHIAATIAGSVADAQALMDLVKAEINLYKVTYNKTLRVKAAARILANMLFSSRVMPYIMQSIIGGVDDTGARLFSLDFFGSVAEEKYFSTGSGSPVAYGVLENGYREGLNISEGIDLAIRAVYSALERDIGTGDGITVCTITEEGFNELSKEEITKRLDLISKTRKKVI